MTMLDDLPRIAERSVSTPEALAELVEQGQPAVVQGLAALWPSVAAGRRSPDVLNTYLRAMGEGVSVPVMEAPAAALGHFGYGPDLSEFSFTKRQRPLGETLDRIAALAGRAEAPVVAIQMLPLAQLPGFAPENPMPLVPGDTTPRLWLGGPVKTQIHNDRDHNLAVVIAGQRRFVLFPPDQVGNLYIGPPDNPPPLSLVDPEAPDLAHFPRFAAALAAARVAHLEPGDAIVMPRYWWHHVTSAAPYNAMVNYWWGAQPDGLENPHDIFLAALLALKDLPAPEREYWRAMFAAYVFQSEGDRTDHLPAMLRGPLGRMASRDRAALKQQLRIRLARGP
ncbi:cupin-like domain-containing protein [Sphingomonas sp. JC676]|uniref:cupin-like domain-containing protein n=1 Tax=Sphingomonas sp. JC676 TaxID=2768065 RepID=UPI00165858FB|nr:cupin-like domain-containing protein [Sphingomonas sp. JC676]MBC9032163.1 cupin-like domain-containing protein [Sphingomonas sp. JC676]